MLVIKNSQLIASEFHRSFLTIAFMDENNDSS